VLTCRQQQMSVILLWLTECGLLSIPLAMTVGANIRHYKILSRIGEGGMGVVYLAEDTTLHRKIALKLLSEEFTKDENRVRRFQQEARAASALNHPNIITIFEVGEADSLHFIATEFIDGETLRERMTREPLLIREAISIAIQIARALAVAHAHGIIHRDIKPENVMLRPDGYVKVLDFGLAKLTEKSGPHEVRASDPDAITKSIINTDPGIVMGTVSYMSPEQARGARLDARTDTFSLGVVLYEMISGRKPFEAGTISDVLALILYKEPLPLARFSPDAPDELERIVHKALSKDREERYQTVKDMAIDLRRLRQRLDVEAELERSRPSSFGDEVTISTRGGGRRSPTSAARQANHSSGRTITTALDAGAVRTTSSAEYLVGEIKRHKKSAAFIVAALVVALACFTYFTGATKSHPIDSLAVLPFINLSADQNAEHLTDGVTESIINSLSRVPNLRVMSFSSVYRFKNQQINPQSVGKDLRVHAVLTGRVTQRGDNLAVSIELVDAEDNSHIWGNQYSRKFSEILLVQEEIARDVSEKLQLDLKGEEKKRFEAFQLYLKGRSYWNKRTPDAIRKGAEYFEQAIAKDGNYASAYAGLADCYNMLVLYSALPPTEGFPKAKEAAMKALEIDERLSEAHTSLGFIHFRWDRDWAQADREFNRAIELNGNYAPAHQWYANYLVAMGRVSEAIAEAKRTQELDPLSLINRSHLAWILYFAHRYDQAIEACRKSLELDPNFYVARRYLGLAYEQKRMYAEAIQEFQQAETLSGNATLMRAHLGHAYAVAGKANEARQILGELKERARQVYVSAYHIAVIHAGLGEPDQAFEWLEKAYEERAEFLVYLKADPRLDNLRADPRFPALLRRVGLP
jgi:eukaryotic-like serine/threonine-protein kinase